MAGLVPAIFLQTPTTFILILRRTGKDVSQGEGVLIALSPILEDADFSCSSG